VLFIEKASQLQAEYASFVLFFFALELVFLGTPLAFRFVWFVARGRRRRRRHRLCRVTVLEIFDLL
jgi:hypothetical protein